MEANACAIPLDSQEFDRLLAVECIFAFPSRQQFFQQAYRLLKPGGKLTICDFLPVSWFAGIWQFWESNINHIRQLIKCNRLCEAVFGIFRHV